MRNSSLCLQTVEMMTVSDHKLSLRCQMLNIVKYIKRSIDNIAAKLVLQLNYLIS